ncbi:hypothetical protein C8J57DRAFT_1589856 [Mycena rebaudengoi]|nr:hypothetical protein C8J57DRAFT_1589856 [Mycena rebaudengoi]
MKPQFLDQGKTKDKIQIYTHWQGPQGTMKLCAEFAHFKCELQAPGYQRLRLGPMIRLHMGYWTKVRKRCSRPGSYKSQEQLFVYSKLNSEMVHKLHKCCKGWKVGGLDPGYQITGHTVMPWSWSIIQLLDTPCRFTVRLQRPRTEGQTMTLRGHMKTLVFEGSRHLCFVLRFRDLNLHIFEQDELRLPSRLPMDGKSWSLAKDSESLNNAGLIWQDSEIVRHAGYP